MRDMSTAGATDNVLEVRDLSVAYGINDRAHKVVHDVSFDLPAGCTLGIVGESGSGKSTTLHALTKLLPPSAHIESSGIKLNGRDISSFKDRELASIRGREIGVIFQNPMSALNPSMRVVDQIREPLAKHLDLDHKESLARINELLALVGLPDDDRLLKAYPHELSGGMKQRIMIAMALSCNPSLLLADEPTTALDVTIQAQIVELLKELTTTLHMSLILVTHDLGVIANIADLVAVMYQGSIVEANLTDEVFYNTQHPYTKQLLEFSSRYRA